MGDRQLDFTETNSKPEVLPLGVRVRQARTKAGRSVGFQEKHRLLDTETGAYLGDDEGNPFTLADVAKSWYTEKGVRKQAYAMAKRVSRSEGFGTRYRPAFLTLTVAPGASEDGLEGAWETVGKELNRFLTNIRQYVQKRFGVKLAYFWVLEVHPDPTKEHYGWPHYHMVLLGMPFIPAKTLSAWWGMGFIKVKMLDGLGGVVRYMGKYMWKACEIMTEGAKALEDMPDWWFYYRVFKRRRCGFSRFYNLPLMDRLPGWLREQLSAVSDASLITKVQRIAGGGWRVWWLGEPGDLLEFSFDVPSKWRIV